MSMLFNSTNGFGTTTVFLTNYVTGSLYITMLLYVILFTAWFISIGLDREWIAVIMSIIFLALSAYIGDWFTFFGIIILFFAAAVTKRITS